MEVQEIYNLARRVFGDDNIHLSMKFNEYIHDGDYNRARVITESLRAIEPDNEDILELDTVITDLCIKMC